MVSWYPNRLDGFDGDFIKRHATAAALYCKVHVIYVKKDEGLKPGTSVTKNFESDNLSEEIIYYNAYRLGVGLIDKILSNHYYKKHFSKAIKKYIHQSGRPSLVHVHVAMKAGLAALWIKKKLNIPFIITEHWTGYHKQSRPSVYDYNPVIQKLNKKIFRAADMLLPVSNDLGKTINEFLPGLPYHVIPNVVDTALFRYKPYASPKFRFIHISYMNFQKNPEGIFSAAKILEGRGYDFEILMLGNENKSLTASANKHGLQPQTVIFKKAVPYVQVASLMQTSSALLLFSRFENLPCVLIEALCCGLPIISTNVGGIAEVINGENGILVESENIQSLAGAMQKMMDNYSNFNQEKICAEASARFNYEKVGRQIADLYL